MQVNLGYDSFTIKKLLINIAWSYFRSQNSWFLLFCEKLQISSGKQLSLLQFIYVIFLCPSSFLSLSCIFASSHITVVLFFQSSSKPAVWQALIHHRTDIGKLLMIGHVVWELVNEFCSFILNFLMVMRLKICRFLACYLVFPFMWPFSTSILFPSPSISFVCCWFIVLQYIQQTAQRGTDLGQNVFCRHANGRLPVYLLFSLKLLCAAYSDAVESGLKKQRLLHSSSLWNLEERRRKAKGDFQSQSP